MLKWGNGSMVLSIEMVSLPILLLAMPLLTCMVNVGT